MWREEVFFLTLRKLMFRRRSVCGFVDGWEEFEGEEEG